MRYRSSKRLAKKSFLIPIYLWARTCRVRHVMPCKAAEPLPLILPTEAEVCILVHSLNLMIKSHWAYQRSADIVPFSSKFDHVIDGKAQFSKAEQRGLALFNGKAKCAGCHVTSTTKGFSKPLVTDYTYDNLGVPRNPQNPVYRFAMINPDGYNWTGQGLGAILRQDGKLRSQANSNIGKFKVPTLRNVARKPNDEFVRSYMHNGYFRSLEQVVDFYNSRDVKPRCKDRFTDVNTAQLLGCWPEPEVSQNLNKTELGNLGLNDQEKSDLVSFLKTLSDVETS